MLICPPTNAHAHARQGGRAPGATCRTPVWTPGETVDRPWP